MKQNCLYILLILYTSTIYTINYNYVITNEAPQHTRIGDIFTEIIKALWFAHKHGIPYVHQTCAYTEQMCIDRCTSYYHKNYINSQWIYSDEDFDHQPCTAYKVSYKYGTDQWGKIEHNDEWQHFKAMRNDIKSDKFFLKQLRLLLRPKHMPPYEPSNMITVAMHMRTAGQYSADTERLAQSLTLRFMPDLYYVWALKQLCTLYPNQHIYVRVFTDDSDPAARVRYLQQELVDYPLIFSYRAHNNRHDANVLEDLWTMTYYDCLIRPWSQYSFYAELLGNHKLIIFAERQYEDSTCIGIRYEDDSVEYKEVVL